MLPSIFGENLFDDFFDNSFEKGLLGTHNPLYGKHAKNLMKTDIKETNCGYEVFVDLPGFKKDEINVEVNDGYLTVNASKDLNKEEKGENGRYIRQERYSGACSRSFYIGDVTPEEVKAKFECGVLTLTVPRKESRELPASRKVAIE